MQIKKHSISFSDLKNKDLSLSSLYSVNNEFLSWIESYSSIQEYFQQKIQPLIATLRNPILLKKHKVYSSVFLDYESGSLFDFLVSFKLSFEKNNEEISRALNLLSTMASFDPSSFRNYFDFSDSNLDFTGFTIGYNHSSSFLIFLQPHSTSRFEDLSDTPSAYNLANNYWLFSANPESSDIDKESFDVFKNWNIIHTAFPSSGTYLFDGNKCVNNFYFLNVLDGATHPVVIELGSSFDGCRVGFKTISGDDGGSPSRKRIQIDTSLFSFDFSNVESIPLVDKSLSFIYYEDTSAGKGRYILYQCSTTF